MEEVEDVWNFDYRLTLGEAALLHRASLRWARSDHVRQLRGLLQALAWYPGHLVCCTVRYATIDAVGDLHLDLEVRFGQAPSGADLAAGVDRRTIWHVRTRVNRVTTTPEDPGRDLDAWANAQS